MLFQHLTKIANTAPNSSGLRAGANKISYAQVAINVERLAAGLSGIGIERGTRVAILLPNGPDFFTLTYAICALGAIAVPVNEASGQSELDWVRDRCRFGAIIGADNLLHIAKKLILFNAPRTVPIISMTTRGGADFCVAELVKSTPIELPKLGPDTVASYLLSSGSTGRPKLVPHTHGQLIACAKIASLSLKLTPEDTILNALPAHHAFGFLNGCFEVMSAGASTYYWADPGPLMLSRKRFLELLRTEKISVMPGVPYIYQTLSEVRQAVNLPDMRLIYSSGIALKRNIYDAFKTRFNLILHQGYGCTETGMISLNGAGDVTSPWDSVGPASPGVAVSLRPKAGQPEGVGELFMKSAAVIDGYVEGTPEENAVFVDGGYLTGDLARFDALGNIYIIGRTKLIIEVAGEKIDPFEIEDVLCQCEQVSEAVVVGVPDPRTGEQRLKAYIVQAQDVAAPDLIEFCSNRLMTYKVPQIIEFIDKVPKSATGKVQRGKLMA